MNKFVSVMDSCAVLLLVLLIKFSQTEAALYFPYTSCVGKDSPWQKGSGAPIRSFIHSIVPTITKERAPGIYALFSNNRQNVLSVANSYNTKAFGWKKFGNKEFDGWLYGHFENIRTMTGDNLTYVYDDFSTVLKGKFYNGEMISARRATIKGFRCKNGMMQIQTTRPNPRSYNYFYEQPKIGFITSYPKVMDPYDMRSLYIKNSSIPAVVGDGIFAKRNIIQGSLVAYYSGAPLYDYNTVMFPNMTVDEKEERHKNLLSFNDDYDLDIPEVDITKYRASLGHKANHAFDANVKFCFVKSPRMGEIRCLEAIKDIFAGDEITVDYRYNLDSNYVPRWYLALYAKTYPEEREKALAQLRKKNRYK